MVGLEEVVGEVTRLIRPDVVVSDKSTNSGGVVLDEWT